jgi:hypothetical protein
MPASTPRRTIAIGPVMLVALALPVACASAPASDPALVAYVESASHLDESQRRALLEGRPFEGMTAEEAELVLLPEGAEVLWLGEGMESAIAFYRGRAGRYALRFEGSPPRVVDWVLYPEEDPSAPGALRPDPPR